MALSSATAALPICFRCEQPVPENTCVPQFNPQNNANNYMHDHCALQVLALLPKAIPSSTCVICNKALEKTKIKSIDGTSLPYHTACMARFSDLGKVTSSGNIYPNPQLDGNKKIYNKLLKNN